MHVPSKTKRVGVTLEAAVTHCRDSNAMLVPREAGDLPLDGKMGMTKHASHIRDPHIAGMHKHTDPVSMLQILNLHALLQTHMAGLQDAFVVSPQVPQ